MYFFLPTRGLVQFFQVVRLVGKLPHGIDVGDKDARLPSPLAPEGVCLFSLRGSSAQLSLNRWTSIVRKLDQTNGSFSGFASHRLVENLPAIRGLDLRHQT